MDVNESVGREWFQYSMRYSGKITKDALIALLKEVVEGIQRGTLNKHGKQSLKNLVGQGHEINQMALDKEAFSDLSKFLQKNKIDFAVDEVKEGQLPIFFKARDISLIEHALKTYIEKEISLEQEQLPGNEEKGNSKQKYESKNQEKTPIEQKIVRAKEKAANQSIETVEKTKEFSKEVAR